jgi:D-alanine-D-alanine ligase
MEAGARELALTMFQTLGCRDIARVDLRVDARGELYFLEINPLPSLDPDLGLSFLAECLGTTYAALIGRILDAALERHEGDQMEQSPSTKFQAPNKHQ